MTIPQRTQENVSKRNPYATTDRILRRLKSRFADEDSDALDWNKEADLIIDEVMQGEALRDPRLIAELKKAINDNRHLVLTSNLADAIVNELDRIPDIAYKRELLKIAKTLREDNDPFAVWEGVCSTMTQANDAIESLRRFGQSVEGLSHAFGQYGWIVYNDGPSEWHWFAKREECEHELSSDIMPATFLEKTFFNRNGNRIENPTLGTAERIKEVTFSPETIDVHGLTAAGYQHIVGGYVIHSGNDKTYTVVGIQWMGATDEWAFAHISPEGIMCCRPLGHLYGRRSNGDRRYWLSWENVKE